MSKKHSQERLNYDIVRSLMLPQPDASPLTPSAMKMGMTNRYEDDDLRRNEGYLRHTKQVQAARIDISTTVQKMLTDVAVAEAANPGVDFSAVRAQIQDFADKANAGLNQHEESVRKRRDQSFEIRARLADRY